MWHLSHLLEGLKRMNIVREKLDEFVRLSGTHTHMFILGLGLGFHQACTY